MVRRQSQRPAYLDQTSGDEHMGAVERLEKEASFHGLCASKREIFVEELKVEQPCLFEAWALEPCLPQVKVGDAGVEDDSALRMAVEY